MKLHSDLRSVMHKISDYREFVAGWSLVGETVM
jgi:hypothetical protein